MKLHQWPHEMISHVYLLNKSRTPTYSKQVDSARSTMDKVSAAWSHGKQSVSHGARDGIYVGIPSPSAAIGGLYVVIYVLMTIDQFLLGAHVLPHLLKITADPLHLPQPTTPRVVNLQFSVQLIDSLEHIENNTL